MNERVLILNIDQANTFVQHNCKVVGVVKARRAKVAIVFERDELFNTMLKRWHNKEFVVSHNIKEGN